MNILLLEDRGSYVSVLTEALEEMGFKKVFPCCNLFEAKDTWEACRDTIDCVIVDLAMNTAGLSEQETEDSQRGYFTGWVFLKECVFRDRPDFAPHCLILSYYGDTFAKYLRDNPDQPPKDFKTTQILSKNDPDLEKKLQLNLIRIEALVGRTV